MQPTKRSALQSALLHPYFVPACLAANLFARLTVIWLIPIDQFSDALWYYHTGINIASGRGYTDGGIATAYWPPGWPGLLGLLFSLFGSSALVGQLANVVFAVLTFLLSLSLAPTLFSDKLVGPLTALILTFYPNQIGYVPALGTEIFYTALLLLAIFVLVRGDSVTRLIISGILLGIATLTKAQTLFIPAFLLAAWWLLSGDRGRLLALVGRVAVVYASMAIVVLPWTARNYAVLGEFVPISTNGGGTLLSGNNPNATGDYTENDALVKQVPNDVAGQVANDRLATSLAVQWIRSHPIDFLLLIPRKIWRLWAPDGEAEWSYEAGFKHYDDYWVIFRVIRVFNQLYYTCLIVLFIISTIYFVRQWRALSPYAATGYILAGYTTLISIVFSGQSRFHFPVMPWIAMYAAWTIIQWAGKSEPLTAPRSRPPGDRNFVTP